ncbi:DNA topoisomerase 3, putative [Plasmodium vivax]|uniref:DNA topoisomerase n=3 Tax=Plasmodium vivax TaxID=5855 RepID=A0A0J9T7Z1_PLAVI|nr:DNA topoisomerase III alpha [Plasmodium vivax Mauritania I]KMZ98358.1 DNA topoisomerase III alpha [Plasmodium vivax North Korean]SCO73926.1 DNA topoisomerase 3, putative [Plasmodium vivax]
MARIHVLNVAEKPSVASAIADILSRGKMEKKKSCSKYNPLFTFNYKRGHETWSMYVTSVTGHLTEQKFDDKYRNWVNTDPQELFDAEITIYVENDKKKIENNLKNYSKFCSLLILWLDCDREGEHICFEVINTCFVMNREIKIKRAQFSAVTQKDIIHAINNLKYPNRNLAYSVDVRREIDLRMGSIFTRFLTIRYVHLIKTETSIISYGPCQFPTLGFVVNRYMDIKNFVNEYYWSIKMQYWCEGGGHSGDESEGGASLGRKKRKRNGKNSAVMKNGKKSETMKKMAGASQNTVVDFTWSRLRLYDHLAVVLIYEELLKNPLCRITNIYENQVKKYRPLPLNTLQMTKLVSRHFHISSKQCMNIAEKLYNRGFISYPRTETNYFPSSMNLRSIVAELKKSKVFGSYAKKLCEGNNFREPRKGRLNDQAHPPIHPVKNMHRTDKVEEREWAIYELICRHFLAVCSDDAIGFNSKVVATIGKEEFFCKGLKIVKKNYLEIYIYEKWNDKILPPFQVNQEFYPYSLLVDEGMTQPPKYLSECDLLSLMDKYGIGTDATMHEHIENIQKRNYVFKNKKNLFIPTNLGIALVLSYKKFKDIGVDLTEPSLRAKMEKDMTLVASGTKEKDETIRNYIDIMKYIYQEIYNRIDLLDEQIKHYLNSAEGAGLC